MPVEGFVYVLSNESMPGVVKIGKTTRAPMDRAKQLYTSGVLMPFVVEYAVYSPDIDTLERDAHEELNEYRVSNSREFFRVDVCKAIQTIVGSTICDHNLKIAPDEQVIDDNDLLLCAHRSGVNAMTLTSLIEFIPPEAWRQAEESYNNTMERRRAYRLKVAPIEERV